ncbi:MAG: hypothetical protein ACM3PT_03410 [Deltaproteobacteria bacterium]
MKYILFCGLILLYGFQCDDDIEYDGSERYRLKGTILDEKGLPVKNIGLSLFGFANAYYENLIQKGVTDNEGRFDLIFSKNNATTHYLEINSFYNNYSHPEYLNDKYSEKFIFFKQLTIVNNEIDMTAHCTLVPGVPLNFVCEDSETVSYYSIYYQTSQDIYLDETDKIKFERRLPISSGYTRKIIVPANSKVKILINSSSKSIVDSIYTTDVPFTYTFK